MQRGLTIATAIWRSQNSGSCSLMKWSARSRAQRSKPTTKPNNGRSLAKIRHSRDAQRIRDFQNLVAGRHVAFLLCTAAESARAHGNPKQRAAACHVERPLVGTAERQVLAAPRNAPYRDNAQG